MRFVLGAVAVGAVLVACASPSTSESTGDSAEAITGSSASALTTDDAVNRAMLWANAKLQYCWTPNGGNNHTAGDLACAEICKRTANPEWDPYRSDCSGLVSWAWNLPAPGRTTLGFYPYQKDITVGIQAMDLRAGDAINNNEHVMLFKEWVTVGKRATFIEEPGCSSSTPYAHEVTSDVTINGMTITPAVEGRSFTAIRYTKLALATTESKQTSGATPTTTPSSTPASTPDDSTSTSASTPSASTPEHDDGQPASTGAPVKQDAAETNMSCAMGTPSRQGSSGFAALVVLGLALARRRRAKLPV